MSANPARSRGNGEGSVYREDARRKNGPVERWIAQVIVDGRKRRVVAPTEAAAKRKLRELVRAAEDGTPVANGNRTVKDLLVEWEAKALPNRNLEPATLVGHRSAIKVLTAEIGGKRLKSLTAEDVEKVLAKRVVAGRSKASCLKLRTTLGMALTWAVRRRYVAHNIASVVEIPADARPAKTGRAMTAEQANAFLQAARGTPLEAMWITALTLGLRPGEVAALAWDDIDFKRGVIHVHSGLQRDEHGAARVGPTKTAQSVRSLDAPANVLVALRAHRSRQAAQQLTVGHRWHNEHNLVFTSPTGAPSDPSENRREFAAVIKAAKLGDGWTPNALRHTAASLLSDAGVPLELVADQLGHRDTRMASLHYRHRVRPTVDGGKTLGAILGGAS